MGQTIHWKKYPAPYIDVALETYPEWMYMLAIAHPAMQI